MARKKKEEEKTVYGLHAEVTQQQISETLETNYMPYAMSVIVSRAIPEIDGFKPSHRKLLYTMYTICLLYTSGGPALLQNIFIGVILTATSVSITVEALREMGKLTTKVGNTILAAAIIDDILGLVALTIVTAIGGADVNIWIVLLKIVLFFVFVGVAGFVVHCLMNRYAAHVRQKDLHRFPILGFVLCLIFAYCAEEFFGVEMCIRDSH